MTAVEVLRNKLIEIETDRQDEDFPGQTDEYRRNVIVRACHECVSCLIAEGTRGSVEETEYLLSAVTMKLQEQLHHANQSRMLRYDLENRQAK